MEQYKDSICIGFTKSTIDWLMTINQISNQAIGIWLRAMLVLHSRDGMMPLHEMMRLFIGHNISRQKVQEILVESQCFATDDAGEMLTFTQFAKENFPKPLACTHDRNDHFKQERNNKRKNINNIGGNKKSFAELSNTPSSPEEKSFYEQMAAHCPRVCQMEEPLTYQQYLKLLDEGTPLALIRNTLQDMENHRDLLKKYVSANLTLRKWMRNS